MKTVNITRPDLRKNFLILGSLALLLFVSLVIISAVMASPPPPLDDEILMAKALNEARLAGLIGEPRALKAVRMSLAEWNALIDAELGKDAAAIGLVPDMPVFVLAIRGDVEWRALGYLPQPGQDSPERFDNITVVLNARTGDLLWLGSYRPGYPSPVSVP